MHITLYNTKIYIDFRPVSSIPEWLKDTSKGADPIDTNIEGVSWNEFFTDLYKLEKDKRKKESSKYGVISARALEVLLPSSLTTKEITRFSKMIYRSVMQQNKHLPYAVWLVTKGKGRYLEYLISERYWSEEEQVHQTFYTSPRYRSSLTGKLCKKDDEYAVMFAKEGDVKQEWKSHFSLKSRLFSNDSVARSSLDRKERIGWDRLMERIRQNILAVFLKHGVKCNNYMFIPRVKRREGLNKFQNINVSVINQTIEYMELALKELWQVLICGYYIQHDDVYQKYLQIYRKYRAIVRDKTYFIRASRHTFTIKYSVFQRVDRCREAMEGLKEMFDKELGAFYERVVI